MTKELAKTLTTALVQWIDKTRPEGTVCCSSYECESIEQMFEGGCYDIIEAFIRKKLTGLTEFEQCLLDYANARDEFEFDSTKVVELNNKVIELTRSYSKKLLALAKKELCPFCDEHLKGFSEGYDKANEEKSYHIPVMPTPPSGWGCDGTHCTNPHMDCINCPRKTTGGFNTQSGTSTLKAEGNTSVTDGKPHNPSFTD